MYPFLEPSNPALSAAGKNVLITGVSGGIGKAIAQAWAIAGARAIVITGRKADVLLVVKEQLEEIKGSETIVVVVAADITKEEDVERLWEQANKQVGRIDVLVNNAGSLTPARIGAIEPSKWWQDFVNLLFSHAVLANLDSGSQCQGSVSKRTLLSQTSTGWQGNGDYSVDRHIRRHLPRLCFIYPEQIGTNKVYGVSSRRQVAFVSHYLLVHTR
jgi:NAD(P)-dependent dehydrogenase (short-subunit alcohol dehydrogenase family)